MKLIQSIKDFVANNAMKSLMIAALAIGTVGFATVSYGSNTANNNSASCLDGSKYQSFRVSYQSRTTGTLSTADGKPLCKDSPMLFQSFDFASTWDGKNFLTSLPQTIHGYKHFTFPGKKANHKVTMTVTAPDECKPTQIDFYTGSTLVKEIPRSNPHFGEDREVRSGKIFNPTEECVEPVYECASLSRIQKDRTSYTFRGKARVANGAVLDGFTFNLGDGTTKYVAYTKHASDTKDRKFVDLDHTYKKAGTYNVKITAHFTVKGKKYTNTADRCQKPVTIKDKPVVKVAECVNLSAQRIGAKSFKLDATAKVSGGATISSYYFVVRNLPSDAPSTDPIYFEQRVNTSATTASVTTGEISTLKAGQSYRATVSVATSEGVKTSTDCTVRVTTKAEPAPEMVEACNTKTGTIEKVEKGKANTPPYTTDLTQCDDVEVCDPETGDIITVKESEADKYADEDSDECKEEPPVVKELPKTGLSSQLTNTLGLGVLTTALYYYASTRRR